MTLENCEWIDAIAQHPMLSPVHVLAACALLGAETDLTDDQLTTLSEALAGQGFLSLVTAPPGEQWYRTATPVYTIGIPR